MADGPSVGVVAADHDGVRIDVVVAAVLGVSRSRAAALADAGAVTLDGQPAGRSTRAKRGQRLAIDPQPAAAADRPPPLPPVRYQDGHLLVVAKPAGLVVHPGSGRASGTLVDALRAAGVPLAAGSGPERPGIVHRLDRGTSGLLVVAKTADAYDGLVAALARRAVSRAYLALVQGVPAAARGRVEAPIGRARDRKRFTVDAAGKPAVTHFEVTATGAVPGAPGGRRVALLRCRLETGRTHQIRVHLSHAGHPVVGDRSYGADAGTARALGLERPFLHAAELAFDHPVTGARVALTEPLPDDLRRAARVARVR